MRTIAALPICTWMLLACSDPEPSYSEFPQLLDLHVLDTSAWTKGPDGLGADWNIAGTFEGGHYPLDPWSISLGADGGGRLCLDMYPHYEVLDFTATREQVQRVRDALSAADCSTWPREVGTWYGPHRQARALGYSLSGEVRSTILWSMTPSGLSLDDLETVKGFWEVWDVLTELAISIRSDLADRRPTDQRLLGIIQSPPDSSPGQGR